MRELKKIKLAWPSLNYSTAPGVLILHPSTPAIAPLNQAQLTNATSLPPWRVPLSVRLRTNAGKRYKRVQSATALIWRVLMVAEKHPFS